MAHGDIGKRVKQAREALPFVMPASELARALGISTSRLSNWENGKRDPDREMLRHVALCLRVSPKWLLTGEEPPTVRENSRVYNPASASIYDLLSARKILALWRRSPAANPPAEISYVRDSTMEISAFFLQPSGNASDFEVIRVGSIEMAPRLNPGDIVLIRLDPTPIPGCIGFVKSTSGDRQIKALDGSEESVIGHAVMIRRETSHGDNIEWRDGNPLRTAPG